MANYKVRGASLLGKIIASGGESELEITGIGDYDFLLVKLGKFGTTAVTHKLEFNSDTGANYDYQQLFNATSYSFTAQNALFLEGNSQASELQGELTIYQTLSTETKMVTGKICIANNNINDFVGEWNNTASKITGIKYKLSSTGFDAGSYLAVYGVNL